MSKNVRHIDPKSVLFPFRNKLWCCFKFSCYIFFFPIIQIKSVFFTSLFLRFYPFAKLILGMTGRRLKLGVLLLKMFPEKF